MGRAGGFRPLTGRLELRHPSGEASVGLGEAALSRGFGVLAGDHTGARNPDAALLAAFPLDRSRVCGETLSYSEEGRRSDDYEAPFDVFMGARMLVHRLMRLAFEEEADWLVQTLERESVAAQAAYALALDPDRPPA